MQSEKAPGSELEYEPAGGAAAGAATVTAGGAGSVTVTGAAASAVTVTAGGAAAVTVTGAAAGAVTVTGAGASAVTVTAGGAAAVTVTGAGVAAGWTDALPEALPTAIRATAPTTAPAIHSHLRLFFFGAGATGGAAKSVLIMKPFCLVVARVWLPSLSQWPGRLSELNRDSIAEGAVMQFDRGQR